MRGWSGIFCGALLSFYDELAASLAEGGMSVEGIERRLILTGSDPGAVMGRASDAGARPLLPEDAWRLRTPAHPGSGLLGRVRILSPRRIAPPPCGRM